MLLSPAKTFDLTTPVVPEQPTGPRLLDQSEILVRTMRRYSPATMRSLMKVSEEIAALNVERFRAFETPFTPDNARPAISMFAGDVYRGLDAVGTFSSEDHAQAQQMLRILSGLYGVLRPLDLIQPYRLEMHIPVRTRRGGTLHDFWGDRLTRLLAADLVDSPGAPVVVNLASREYSSAVSFPGLGAEVISPRFEDISASGQRKVISLFAKLARGRMAGWIIRERITHPDELVDFALDGYHYDPETSTPTIPVFFRR